MECRPQVSRRREHLPGESHRLPPLRGEHTPAPCRFEETYVEASFEFVHGLRQGRLTDPQPVGGVGPCLGTGYLGEIGELAKLNAEFRATRIHAEIL